MSYGYPPNNKRHYVRQSTRNENEAAHGNQYKNVHANNVYNNQQAPQNSFNASYQRDFNQTGSYMHGAPLQESTRDDSFHFEQRSPAQQYFANQGKPALPPKIPMIPASPSTETLSAAAYPSSLNESFSKGPNQRNNNRDSVASSTSSVDDLIDRYMENVSFAETDKKPFRPIASEKEIDSPPPYEELPPHPAIVDSKKKIESKIESPTVSIMSKIESSGNSVSSAPYPEEDTIVEPVTRPRRYTDELLDEVRNGQTAPSTDQQPKAVPASLINLRQDPIEDFIKARNDALSDHKNFTLSIQLKWAKILLEAIDNSKIINTINISGQHISSKDMKRNKIAFLQTAIKVLKRLSEKHNDPESQAILGDLYSGYTLADLTDKDIQKGFEYYLKATKGKHPNATYKTGCCVEHGMGTRSDVEKCFHFYEKSALLGDPDGMCKLGIVYIKGLLNQPKSAQKSVYWLNKAIATKDTSVLPIYILAKIHETDLNTLDLKPHRSGQDAQIIRELQNLKIYHDYKTALQLYLKAAKFGHVKSQSHLGFCYEYGSMGCTVNPKTSIYWYSKAAQKGDAVAEMGLSGWYLTGAEGLLQQSDTEAYLWARKASEKGSVKAEYALGYFNEVGVGTNKNLNEARRWYKIAASQGYAKAIKKLESLR